MTPTQSKILIDADNMNIPDFISQRIYECRPYLKGKRMTKLNGSGEYRAARKLAEMGYGEIISCPPAEGSFFMTMNSYNSMQDYFLRREQAVEKACPLISNYSEYRSVCKEMAEQFSVDEREVLNAVDEKLYH